MKPLINAETRDCPAFRFGKQGLSQGFPISATGLESGCFWISDFVLVSDSELWVWVFLSLPSPSPVTPPAHSCVQQSVFPPEISASFVPACDKASVTHHLHKSPETVAVSY